MAEIKGEHVSPISTPLVVGSYTHAAFESDEAFAEVEEQYSDMIHKKRGGKYSDFEIADRMIDAVKNDSFCMHAMDGEKEVIYTAELFGAPWKIKVDSINHQRRTFTDLKTTQDLYKRYWSTKYEGWVSFIEAWDYVLQMALYRRVIAENTGEFYDPYVVAVTKENPVNKAVIHFERSRFDFEMEYIEHHMDRLISVKQENEEPKQCGKCEYCRQTKMINGTIEVGDLIHG
ncbi:PD-(D/E)XK nuclease-like domain-containing protein [Geomicrobium sp. JCM 19038]|uniref:PD-(D/E)XK nuclease-like domain-containing protein n=1 Tax=Geomicrobium sp. JCM 19038 TaxID=1460635 RepID=UPI00045F2142|nr:prophage Lp1 protein 19 [Geomicrobium sp. JCM 19038]